MFNSKKFLILSLVLFTANTALCMKPNNGGENVFSKRDYNGGDAPANVPFGEKGSKRGINLGRISRENLNRAAAGLLIVGAAVGATAATIYATKKVYNVAKNGVAKAYNAAKNGATKLYDNREEIANKVKSVNSAIANKIEGFGNFIETVGVPGKTLVDGAKFGWDNKIAAIATYVALDRYLLRRTFNGARFPMDATITTLLAFKVGSLFAKYEKSKQA